MSQSESLIDDVYELRLKFYKRPTLSLEAFETMISSGSKLDAGSILMERDLKGIPEEFHKSCWDKSRIQYYEKYKKQAK